MTRGDRAAAELVLRERFGVSRETLERLAIYAGLLESWQRRFNLVGPSTIPELWSRHFVDSWQLLACAKETRRWLDLGSGAGFPGAVLAIAMADLDPEARVVMIESNGKKVAFLREVVRQTGARAEVRQARIEDEIRQAPIPEVVTARAVASLRQLLDWTHPLLEQGAVALFPKGRDLEREIAEAAISWDMSFDILPSVVDESSSILRVTSAKPKGYAKVHER